MSRLRFSLHVVGGLVGATLVAVAQAQTYVLPPEDVNIIGQVQTVTANYHDTLSDIARRYAVGYEQIVQANPNVDAWLPGEGSRVVVPTRYILPDTPRAGIVLNLPEMRLYYYPRAKRGETPVVVTYPVSIGRMDWNTPLGLTKVVGKVTNPTWTPPKSIRKEHAADGDVLPPVVAAGPDNPLGKYALRLGVPGYLIHGTNKPYGVGMRVTHGCVRMYPENIESLYKEVPVGTPVRIVNQPFKAGWLAGNLYLEADSPLEDHRKEGRSDMDRVLDLLNKLVAGRRYQLDEEAVRRVVEEQRGIPTVVGHQSSW